MEIYISHKTLKLFPLWKQLSGIVFRILNQQKSSNLRANIANCCFAMLSSPKAKSLKGSAFRKPIKGFTSAKSISLLTKLAASAYTLKPEKGAKKNLLNLIWIISQSVMFEPISPSLSIDVWFRKIWNEKLIELSAMLGGGSWGMKCVTANFDENRLERLQANTKKTFFERNFRFVLFPHDWLYFHMCTRGRISIWLEIKIR